MSTKVQTSEFLREPTGFEMFLRNKFRHLILNRSAPENRKYYRQQFDEAFRNIEIGAGNLISLLINNSNKSLVALSKTAEWQREYFKSVEEGKRKKQYMIYTKEDSEIPFLPEWDLWYFYMNTQFAYVAKNLAEITSMKEFKNMADGFSNLNEIGNPAFRNYPTRMPRITPPGEPRITMNIIQKADHPLNCCPSFHIAYSMYLLNASEVIIKPRRKEVFDTIELSAREMISSILYTKQHALIDISYGLLAAKIASEKRFPHHPFNDFIPELLKLQEQHPSINYERVIEDYQDALSLYGDIGNFAISMGHHIHNIGFPLLHPGDKRLDTHYFDRKTGKLERFV